MGYAIMRLEKVHANGANTRYKHNYRQYPVNNADISKTALNREIVSLNGKNFQEAYEEKVSELREKGLLTSKIRADAVQGVEVVCEFSRDDMGKIDLDEWVKDNVAWLDKEFNPENHTATGKDGQIVKTDNVVSVVLHMDESKPHLHAYVIPVDEKGHINASFYVGKRRQYIELQNTYAKAMEKHGLVRGTKYSIARAEDMNRYYDALKKSVDAKLPDVYPGETAEEYKKRADEIYAKECIHHRNEIVKERQKYVEIKGVSIEEKTNIRKERESINREKRKFKELTGKDELSEALIRTIRHDYKENMQFKQAVQEYPDRDMAQQTKQNYDQMVLWQQQRERELRKDKEKSKEKAKEIY